MNVSADPDGGLRLLHVCAAAVTRTHIYYVCPCCWLTRNGTPMNGDRAVRGRPGVHFHPSGNVVRVGDIFTRSPYCPHISRIEVDPPKTVLIYITEKTLFIDVELLSGEQIQTLQRVTHVLPENTHRVTTAKEMVDMAGTGRFKHLDQ